MGMDEIFTIPTAFATKFTGVTYNCNCDIEEAQNSIDKMSEKLNSLAMSSKVAEAAYVAISKLVASSTPSIYMHESSEAVFGGKVSEEGYLYQTSLDFNTIGKEPEEEEWPLPF